jgi:hypothetical protein
MSKSHGVSPVAPEPDVSVYEKKWPMIDAGSAPWSAPLPGLGLSTPAPPPAQPVF